MVKIKIKALSINRCFQGRRFKHRKTSKVYEEELLYKLKPYKIPEGNICFIYRIWNKL